MTKNLEDIGETVKSRLNLENLLPLDLEWTEDICLLDQLNKSGAGYEGELREKGIDYREIMSQRQLSKLMRNGSVHRVENSDRIVVSEFGNRRLVECVESYMQKLNYIN